MTDHWIVFVSDHDQIKQLDCEPESVLSMEKALHEVWCPNLVQSWYGNVKNLAEAQQLGFTAPILGPLQVPPEHKGPKSEAFRVVVGVLKNKLRSNLSAMDNAFQTCISEAIALEVAPSNGKYECRGYFAYYGPLDWFTSLHN